MLTGVSAFRFVYFCDSGLELLQSSAFYCQFLHLSVLLELLALVCGFSFLNLSLLQLFMDVFVYLQRLTVLEDFILIFFCVFGEGKDVSVVLLADRVKGL